MTGRLIIVALALVVAGCTTESGEPSTTSAIESEAAPTTVSPDTTETTTQPEPDQELEPTPSQQEGPFYPVSKPDDRDSDLTQVEGAAATAGGEVLIISGHLLDLEGQPVVGGLIEIWQTDEQGIYLHPDDPGVDGRDENFQGYGEVVTDDEGYWEFRTINPGYYEPRPRHIHAKIFIGGDEVLTTQIYFSDDPDAEGIDSALVATITTGEDGALLGDHLFVVDS